ncbi:MAG: endo-1,4-beta-xylanase, partial [Planctomycetes bacterium]|nr:endo-1,4-beta-xylanase [Planctomycetota bacterium]
VERAEASFQWETYDGLLDWALGQGLAVTAGPLIDFSPERLPDWLAPWKQDLSSVASFMCDYVETAVRRYRGRVHSWQLATAANLVSVPGWGEEELTWLIVRLAEVARQVDPKLVLIVGIAQPWGEYLAREERIHSPFIFADNLVRSGLHPGALDLELVMGILPRGSYCRDLLETSRLLDLYSVLGVPLRVTLGYPSAEDNDSQVQGKYLVGAGRWHSGFNPTAQAEWADAYAALALCKPTVRGVHWVHLSDAEAHQFPHCGLFDAQDRPKPVIQSLRELRENHLR